MGSTELVYYYSRYMHLEAVSSLCLRRDTLSPNLKRYCLGLLHVL